MFLCYLNKNHVAWFYNEHNLQTMKCNLKYVKYINIDVLNKRQLLPRHSYLWLNNILYWLVINIVLMTYVMFNFRSYIPKQIAILCNKHPKNEKKIFIINIRNRFKATQNVKNIPYLWSKARWTRDKAKKWIETDSTSAKSR